MAIYLGWNTGRERGQISISEYLLVDPEVWVIDGDAAVVAVAISAEIELEVELELGGFRSAAAHMLAKSRRPDVISEAMSLSDPQFEAEHWIAVLPSLSSFASIAVQTHCRSDSLVLEAESLVQEVPTPLE
ncbi:hypothetical protein N7517_004869 [Penicillium concentricum]|uniref:Uncharacterized protein n=1 Tax=Penicillium concentricum TaxID=293559 RepID=A0A9W9V8J9_9EURO|nr:uncharacterized protein N7517_004869 [Penicillium concentricum]KAJ5372863.1 hypothetical protein N7517_004869 [Penicillium concentricum]